MRQNCETCAVRKHGFCRFVGDAQLSEYESLRVAQKIAPAKSMLDWSRNGQHFHILRRGWAALFGMVEDGRTKVTEILAPGNMAPMSRVFGAQSGLAVRAITDAAYCSFHIAEFQQFLRRHPDLMERFFCLTGGMMQRCEKAAVLLGALPAKDAMLGLLRSLYRKLPPVDRPDGDTVFMPLRIKTLSEYVGITSVHTGRLLSELEEDGILTRTEDGVLLHIPSLLKAAERCGPEMD